MKKFVEEKEPQISSRTKDTVSLSLVLKWMVDIKKALQLKPVF